MRRSSSAGGAGPSGPFWPQPASAKAVADLRRGANKPEGAKRAPLQLGVRMTEFHADISDPALAD